MVGWLVGWVAAWLAGWRVNWFADWFASSVSASMVFVRLAVFKGSWGGPPLLNIVTQYAILARRKNDEPFGWMHTYGHNTPNWLVVKMVSHSGDCKHLLGCVSFAHA